ncbi:peptidoglycan recognition protein family protein [Streptomyces sp. 4N509B]|uniref:peptidoglycan recognition protein family protein n=1 Tax=Streptomyces sp. 4N509B TaxID=3457413 RepID=UPI003FCF8499
MSGLRRWFVWGVVAAVLPLALLVTWEGGLSGLGRDAPTPGAGSGDVGAAGGRAGEQAAGARAAAARPTVVSRVEWGADDALLGEPVTYTGAARAVFVHHTGHPDDYDCAEVPSMLRAMQADHVLRLGWDDLGYNFVVDKCGTIYEGRAGGIDRFVLGAHTTGFNHDSVGIAALGDFPYAGTVPGPVLEAIAKIAAWKLRPGTDPRESVRLVSTNDASRVPEGSQTEIDVITGHRDIYYTHCPGEGLTSALPEIRSLTARLRARAAP